MSYRRNLHECAPLSFPRTGGMGQTPCSPWSTMSGASSPSTDLAFPLSPVFTCPRCFGARLSHQAAPGARGHLRRPSPFGAPNPALLRGARGSQRAEVARGALDGLQRRLGAVSTVPGGYPRPGLAGLDRLAGSSMPRIDWRI